MDYTHEFIARRRSKRNLNIILPEKRIYLEGLSSIHILNDLVAQMSPRDLTLNNNGKLTGAMLVDYQLMKTIGTGGYGKVKLAIHSITKEKVAIKCIAKARLNESEDSIERVLREIIVLKELSLTHPNISRLLEVIDDSEYIYLVLEYASGGELYHHILKFGHLSERESRRLCRQILCAIAYCHSHNIIHRDLKLENILLDAQHNIKIIDFGFANIIQKDRMLETFCGSLAYSAPEMLTREKYTGAEVDVWSMGVILYVMLCGCLPFDDSNISRFYAEITNPQITFPMHIHVSRDCQDLIRRMLTADSKKRIKLSEILQHQWVNEGYNEQIEFNSNCAVWHSAEELNIISPFSLKQTSIDPIIVQEMVAEHGFPEKELTAALVNGEVSNLTASYWLLQGKRTKAESEISLHVDTPVVEEFEYNPIQRTRTKSAYQPTLHSFVDAE